jgi:hypothetical protein
MVSIDKAREFVFSNGTLWERALFSYLFDDGPIERVHQCLLCYKNEDGGWGHGLEHDIKSPVSHPLALEFLLTIFRDTGIPAGNILDGTVEWVERNRKEDGSLENPDKLLDYPHAPWWSEGGQTAPDSITGNLIKLDVCSEELAQSTDRWVRENMTIDTIQQNDWLFMAYHAHDYFMNIPETPETKPLKEATIENIIKCAEQTELKKMFPLFHFAPAPDTELAKALPDELIEKVLDYLASSQREDGGWEDEHGLKYWQSYFTITVLQTLKNYGRLS